MGRTHDSGSARDLGPLDRRRRLDRDERARFSNEVPAGIELLLSADTEAAEVADVAAPPGQVALEELARIGGALAFGALGAKGGAAAGAAIGALFGGAGAAPGAIIGGILGGLGGAIFGGWFGKSIVQKLYEMFPPGDTSFEGDFTQQ